MTTSGRQQLLNMFQGWGFPPEAGAWVWQQVVEGRDIQDAVLLAQEQDWWKQRFIGNEARVKAGLPALDPAQYLAVETQYKNKYRNYGLPAGLYDEPADFAKLIGADVSPDELESRLQFATTRVKNVPQEVRTALNDFYGINEQGLLAVVLDPQRGIQELDRQYRAAETAGAAKIAGVTVGRPEAERLASTGVTFQGALQGFQQVGAEQSAEQRRAFGTPQLSGSQIAEGVFYGDQNVLEQIRRGRAAGTEQSGAGGPLGGARGFAGLGSATR